MLRNTIRLGRRVQTNLLYQNGNTFLLRGYSKPKPIASGSGCRNTEEDKFYRQLRELDIEFGDQEFKECNGECNEVSDKIFYPAIFGAIGGFLFGVGRQTDEEKDYYDYRSKIDEYPLDYKQDFPIADAVIGRTVVGCGWGFLGFFVGLLWPVTLVVGGSIFTSKLINDKQTGGKE